MMPQGIGEWIGKNLWAILALIVSAVASYNLGTATMASMKNDIDGIKAAGAQRREFMNDASQRLEYLCNRDKECTQRFDPMKVPE